MADMLEDGIEMMVDSLLEFSGSSCTYRVSSTGTSSTVTMHKRPQKPQLVEISGQLVEVSFTDFICRTDALTADPVHGDRITVGDESYEVRPVTGEKAFRRLAESMTRIHTQRIGTC